MTKPIVYHKAPKHSKQVAIFFFFLPVISCTFCCEYQSTISSWVLDLECPLLFRILYTHKAHNETLYTHSTHTHKAHTQYNETLYTHFTHTKYTLHTLHTQSTLYTHTVQWNTLHTNHTHCPSRDGQAGALWLTCTDRTWLPRRSNLSRGLLIVVALFLWHSKKLFRMIQ